MSYKRKQEKAKIQKFMYTENVKCMIIPVIIGAPGIVTKVLKKHLKLISGKHSTSTDSLNKTDVII